MKPELLAPVSDFTSLQAAVQGGADSVYFGVKELNMRSTARNFEVSQLPKVCTFCKENKIKSYLCLNTIVYSDELEKLESIIKSAKHAGITAIICWDMAVISLCLKQDVPFVVSTQASISNIQSAKYYQALGADAIVLARELTLEQIKNIKKQTDVKVEVFIHGAMCVSVSGRCFTSQHLFNRSANRGDCLQPCRRKYLIKDIEEGHELELGEDYVMSADDLCTIEFIDQVLETGVDILKIEGRSRPPEYVKTVTSVYREAIDAHFEKRLTDDLKKTLLEKLKTVYHRKFSSGFYFGRCNSFSDPLPKTKTIKQYIGKVKNFYSKPCAAEISVEATDINRGDLIMIQGPTTGVIKFKLESLQSHNNDVEKVSKGSNAGIKTPKTVRTNDKVFRIKRSPHIS